jgi:sensor c-di-GMP phosphodiesterase-like protein
MLTIIVSVVTLVSAASAAASYVCARQAAAAQKQMKILAGQIAERIDEHTQQAAQAVQQAQSHQEQTKMVADKVVERISEHVLKMNEHTQRIEDHTQRVTEWIQQVQSPPTGDPYVKGRAEVAEDPEFLAKVEEIRKSRAENSGLIAPDSDAQSNPVAWRTKLQKQKEQKEQKEKEEVREIAKEILGTPGVTL